MIHRGWTILCAVLLLSLFAVSPSNAKRTPRTKPKTTWQLKMFLAPGYRTNVYKAPPTALLKNDNVNAGGAEFKLEHNLNRNMHVTTTADADGEFYATHTRRNQTSFGGQVETDWRPSRRWRFRVVGNAHRTTRDLIDDSGEFSGRTLAKWVTDLTPEFQYSRKSLRASISYTRSFTNYDESNDSNGVRLKSYDYDDSFLEMDMRLEVLSHWQLRTTYTMDWRDYDERKTLAIDKRSSRPRQFTQRTIEPLLTYDGTTVSPYARYSFTRRKDTFENFYGYDYSKYKVGVDIQPIKRLSADFSFEYEEKDYPNYWTSRIGNAHRVSIQYRDWQLAMKYELLPNLDLNSDLRWYVKTSNDRNFRYRQLSLFVGCELRIGTKGKT